MLKKPVLVTTISIIMLSASNQAISANPTLHDQVSFRAGGYFSNIDTSVTINGEKFDFEEVLDDNVTTGAFTALWRVNSKLRLNFGYWGVDRDESALLSSSDSIGGSNVPAGSTVAAHP